MSTAAAKMRLTSFAPPRFIVGDLERSIAYQGTIGHRFDERWSGFYVIGHPDGLELV